MLAEFHMLSKPNIQLPKNIWLVDNIWTMRKHQPDGIRSKRIMFVYIYMSLFFLFKTQQPLCVPDLFFHGIWTYLLGTCVGILMYSIQRKSIGFSCRQMGYFRTKYGAPLCLVTVSFLSKITHKIKQN